jgi:hypothetical protein
VPVLITSRASAAPHRSKVDSGVKKLMDATSKAQLRAVGDLKKVYGLDYETHSARSFPKQPSV